MKKRGKMEIIRCLLILSWRDIDTMAIMFLILLSSLQLCWADFHCWRTEYFLMLHGCPAEGFCKICAYIRICGICIHMLTIAAQCNAGSDVPKNADAVIVLGAGGAEWSRRRDGAEAMQCRYAIHGESGGAAGHRQAGRGETSLFRKELAYGNTLCPEDAHEELNHN